MRIKHTLWRVSNGWLLVPETNDGYLHCEDASRCAIFKTVKEFADWKPKRERKRAKKEVVTDFEKGSLGAAVMDTKGNITIKKG
jgi:hypothetical protein